MFDYALPSEALLNAVNAIHPVHAAAKKEPEKKKPDDHGDKKKKDQTVHTQMVGEKPGDDLGYDPKKIPVEEIPDD